MRQINFYSSRIECRKEAPTFPFRVDNTTIKILNGKIQGIMLKKVLVVKH